MKRFLSKRNVLAFVVLLTAVLVVVYFGMQPRLAPGQKPLTDIRNIETLRAQFNNDAGKIRLIILVSPT